jgi:hypothetical protein
MSEEIQRKLDRISDARQLEASQYAALALAYRLLTIVNDRLLSVRQDTLCGSERLKQMVDYSIEEIDEWIRLVDNMLC